MKKNIRYVIMIVINFLATSCCIYPDCDQRNGRVDFAYINNTTHDIEFISHSKIGVGGDTIKKQEKIEFNQYNINVKVKVLTDNEKKRLEAFGRRPLVDSTTVKFSDKKCLIYRDQRYLTEVSMPDANNCINERSVYCYNAYKVTLVGENHYRYEYTFTEEDYKMAKPCEDSENK